MDDELFFFFSLKKSSFIIYSIALLTSLLSIFNKFGRKKRQLQREDTQMKKRKNIKDNNTYLDNKVFATINGVVVSILYLFHYETTRLKLFITNLLSLDQDK
jgi:predicted histidine transporter YuiF (NhaC family)